MVARDDGRIAPQSVCLFGFVPLWNYVSVDKIVRFISIDARVPCTRYASFPSLAVVRDSVRVCISLNHPIQWISSIYVRTFGLAGWLTGLAWFGWLRCRCVVISSHSHAWDRLTLGCCWNFFLFLSSPLPFAFFFSFISVLNIRKCAR